LLVASCELRPSPNQHPQPATSNSYDLLPIQLQPGKRRTPSRAVSPHAPDFSDLRPLAVIHPSRRHARPDAARKSSPLNPPARLLHEGTFKNWMLPTLAGVPRTAKPPGMMWLIAASMYFFRSESEWVARLPSALAGFSVAWMIARLAARWFDNRIGRLTGLLQLTFVYELTQAKLAEARHGIGCRRVRCPLCVRVAVIDSPVGLDNSRRTRWTFWLACAAAFLLKGPIGLVFIGLAIASFAVIRRRLPFALRDWRILKFLADPIGIVAFVFLISVWPLLAWRLDPAIVQSWSSEAIGTATGKWGSNPFYYYVWSVPLMLMPWTPFVFLGLKRGSGAEMSGPVNEQVDRSLFWRFFALLVRPGNYFSQLRHPIKKPPLFISNFAAAVDPGGGRAGLFCPPANQPEAAAGLAVLSGRLSRGGNDRAISAADSLCHEAAHSRTD